MALLSAPAPPQLSLSISLNLKLDVLKEWTDGQSALRVDRMSPEDADTGSSDITPGQALSGGKW